MRRAESPQPNPLYQNHGDYVHQVSQGVQELLLESFLQPVDAARIKVEAAQADVPKNLKTLTGSEALAALLHRWGFVIQGGHT